MAERAQELTVTNTGQPKTVDLVATSAVVDIAQELQVLVAGNVSIDIEPASE